MKTKDLSHQKFGKLTAKYSVGLINGRTHWFCKCECGGTKIVSSKELLANHVKSCGCIANTPKNIPQNILVDLYVNKQMTIAEICSELNIKSPKTIIKYMDQYNIPRKNPNKLRKKNTMRGMSNEEFKSYLIEQYATKSINQLSTELNITSAALRKYFVKYKIPFIGHKESNKKYNSGENGNNWKGGRRISSEGYIKIYMPDHPHAIGGAVYEHRYVMEQHIGRLLTKNEVVHHINGNKSDNRLENLMLLTQSEHSKLHRELEKEGMLNE